MPESCRTSNWDLAPPQVAALNPLTERTQMRDLLALWFLLSLTAGALPSSVEQALRQPGPVEIFSLEPLLGPLKSAPTLDGFPILGRAQLSPEEGPRVCSAVLKGLEEGEQEAEPLPSCFEPRHALRFGKLDLVICYSCHRWNAYRQGQEIGSGRVTQRGSEECERAVIENGLVWQGWAEVGKQVFHATGFSLMLPPGLKAARRAKDELLQLDVFMGTVILRLPAETPGWFASGDIISLDSPIPLVEFRESLRRKVPGVSEKFDSDTNELEISSRDEGFFSAAFNLLCPQNPETVSLYPSRDAILARKHLKEGLAKLEARGPLKESSPDVWTSFGQDRFQAATLLEREGRYLVCLAEFNGGEASGRARFEKLLSQIQFRPPQSRP